MINRSPIVVQPVDETLARYCNFTRQIDEQAKLGYVPMEMSNRLLGYGSSAFNVLMRRETLSKEEAVHFSCCLMDALTYELTMTLILRRTVAVKAARTLVGEIEKLLNRRKTLNGISETEEQKLGQYQKALINISLRTRIPLPEQYLRRCTAEEYHSLPRNLWETFFKQIDSIKE